MKTNLFCRWLLVLLALFLAPACGVAEGDDDDGGDEPPVCVTNCNPKPPAPPPSDRTMPDPFTFWDACDDNGVCSASIGVADTYAFNSAGIELRFYRDPRFPETDTLSGPGPNLGGSLFLTKKENGRNIATWMCQDLIDGPHRVSYLASQQNDTPVNTTWATFGTPEFMEKMRNEALQAIYCTYLDPSANIAVTGNRCDGLPVAMHFTDSRGRNACKFVSGGNADEGFGE